MQVKIFRSLADRSNIWICGYKPNLESKTYKAKINIAPKKVILTDNKIFLGRQVLWQKDFDKALNGDYRAYTEENECIEAYIKMLTWANKVVSDDLVRKRMLITAFRLKSENIIARYQNRLEKNTNPS